MSPASGTDRRRWVVVALIVVVLAGVALAAGPGHGRRGDPAPAAAAAVPGAGVESSAWYCAGQTTATGGLAAGSLVLTNSGAATVTGTVDEVTDTGARAHAPVSVPARTQLVPRLPVPTSGTWVSGTVNLSGGGVAVTQAVYGPNGWAESPCQSETAPRWYFPQGTTAGSNALFLALYNPTSTPDVVDVSFTTAAGVLHPINFQGLVLAAGQTQVESIAPFVQGADSVATTVATRTGRMVATELQLLSGSRTGLALVAGAPRAQRSWTIPDAVESAGGTSSLTVFNPGPTVQTVTVRATVGSGPLAPFVHAVAPQTAWVLRTAGQTRIPVGDPYSVVVTTERRGPGVVVGRSVLVPAGAPTPQGGLATAVDALSSVAATRRWIVPSPGGTAVHSLNGARPTRLAVTNRSGRTEGYTVRVMEQGGLPLVRRGTVPAGATVVLDGTVLGQAGLIPLLVQTSGPAAVSEDLGPSGGTGVVTMPGLPLAVGLG